jgi:hypothetical protein
LFCEVERRYIDVTFRLKRESVLVEFKIAYNSDPKPAIREALGQILEYNLYPDRTGTITGFSCWTARRPRMIVLSSNVCGNSICR